MRGGLKKTTFCHAKDFGLRYGDKTFFMLNSTEHEIFPPKVC